MPASYAPTKSDLDYLKYNVALSRQQKIYKDWSVLLRAGGQWTDKSLISNEQFALGGVNSVRGYKEGEVYGDTGWCASIEPHIPAVELGNFTDDGESAPLWFRAWTFVDYGEAYLTDAASGSHKRFQLWGAGIGGMATIGKFFDARLTLAWPLMDTPGTKAGRMGMFFSVGVQF
jgi:hemolysin activation/secretion protein